jgi:hypothetical protein
MKIEMRGCKISKYISWSFNQVEDTFCFISVEKLPPKIFFFHSMH